MFKLKYRLYHYSITIIFIASDKLIKNNILEEKILPISVK